MIVWIWDAPGDGRAGAGVTDSEARARLSAEAFMLQAGTRTARIEKAAIGIGGALTVGYRPTGHGWTAARSDNGTITWTPLRNRAAP